MNDATTIRDQAEKIAASGTLGRSRSYRQLLDFLVERSIDGTAPKEVEIAMEVFGRDADFDPSQDSMVRVYAHNLRQKIHQFYAGPGRGEAHRIAIPKGEYRVALAPPDPDTAAANLAAEPRRRSLAGRLGLAAGAAALVAAGVVLGLVLRPQADSDPAGRYAPVAASPVWSGLLDDGLPIMVVVGDYYIFGELDAAGNVSRLVREFSVNSSKELDDLMMFDPDLGARYIDLDLTYLARSTPFALRDVLRVLYTSDKPVRMSSMSDLTVDDIKSNHIVYIGYISALDKLLDFVFEASSLAVGDTYDEIVHVDTQQLFMSEAALPADRRNYRDYALFSTFPGPADNQFVIVSGTWDAGVMHTAQVISDPGRVNAVARAAPEGSSAGPPAFELLYEVTGFDRTNLDARLVHSAPLDHRRIWGGDADIEIDGEPL